MWPKAKIAVLYQSLGLKIKEARKNANINQEELAANLKISRSSIVNIEKGRQRPPLHLIYAIAQILKIDIQDIMPAATKEIHEDEHKISSQVKKRIEQTARDDASFESIVEWLKSLKKDKN